MGFGGRLFILYAGGFRGVRIGVRHRIMQRRSEHRVIDERFARQQRTVLLREVLFCTLNPGSLPIRFHYHTLQQVRVERSAESELDIRAGSVIIGSET